jgi:tetratricopeptide (TPR) repeat protein
MELPFRHYIVGITILLCEFSFAQDKAVDSIRLALQNAGHDTTRCSVLLGWGEHIYISKPDSAFVIWEQAAELAKKNLSFVSLQAPIKNVFLKDLSSAYNDLGYLVMQKGNIASALEYFGKGLRIQEKTGDQSGIASSLNNIGAIYYNTGDIKNALYNYSRSLKIREKIGDKLGIAYSLNNIGSVYYNQGDLQNAAQYYSKSLKISEGTGDMVTITSALNNLGLVYDNIADKSGDTKGRSKALEYYERGLKLEEKMQDKNGIAHSLNNIGRIYSKQGNVEKALECFNKSLVLREETGDKQGIASALCSIGSAYFKLGGVDKSKKNYALALSYCLRSHELGVQLGYPEIIRNAAEKLNTIYKASGDYKNALKYYEFFILMKDSINNQETKQASLQNQLQYEYGKKTAADSVAHLKENEIRQAQISRQEAELKSKKNQQYGLFGGLTLLIVFAAFMYNRFRVTQKQKQTIEQQKQAVDVKQKEILDSIYYAQKIQRALITNETYVENKLNALTKRRR